MILYVYRHIHTCIHIQELETMRARQEHGTQAPFMQQYMWVCMCAWVCINCYSNKVLNNTYVCVYILLRMYVRMYVCTYAHKVHGTQPHSCGSKCEYDYMHAYMSVCRCIFLHFCILSSHHIRTYTHAHIHPCTNISWCIHILTSNKHTHTHGRHNQILTIHTCTTISYIH